MYIYLELTELLPPVESHKTDHMADIERIAEQVLGDGLLNPFTVKYTDKGYAIVDGKKRYFAIRYLMSTGRLPRTLNRIPCVIDNAKRTTGKRELPQLISHSELFERIRDARMRGYSASELAQRFDCDLMTVHQMLRLEELHPEVLACFRRDHLTFNQAVAFATLPNPQAQWNLLKRLGPFVQEEAIVRAIEDGETVLNLPNGECVILPSRKPVNIMAMTAALAASNSGQHLY